MAIENVQKNQGIYKVLSKLSKYDYYKTSTGVVIKTEKGKGSVSYNKETGEITCDGLQNAIIEGTKYSDKITVTNSHNVKVSGGASDDEFTIKYSDTVQIDGGKGNNDRLKIYDSSLKSTKNATLREQTTTSGNKATTTYYDSTGKKSGSKETIKDGNKTTEKEYDKNGKITKETIKEGDKIVSERKYQSDGTSINVKNNSDGTTTKEYYSSENKLLTEETYYSNNSHTVTWHNTDGSTKTETYNSNNKLESKETINSDKSSQKVTYNSDGSTTTSNYDSNNNLTKEETKSKPQTNGDYTVTENKYNNNKVEEETKTTYNSSNNQINKTETKYNSDGSKTTTTTNKDGSTKTSNYDSNNNLTNEVIKTTPDANGDYTVTENTYNNNKLKEETTITYDSSGNKKEQTKTTYDGDTKKEETFQFDKVGGIVGYWSKDYKFDGSQFELTLSAEGRTISLDKSTASDLINIIEHHYKNGVPDFTIEIEYIVDDTKVETGENVFNLAQTSSAVSNYKSTKRPVIGLTKEENVSSNPNDFKDNCVKGTPPSRPGSADNSPNLKSDPSDNINIPRDDKKLITEETKDSYGRVTYSKTYEALTGKVINETFTEYLQGTTDTSCPTHTRHYNYDGLSSSTETWLEYDKDLHLKKETSARVSQGARVETTTSYAFVDDEEKPYYRALQTIENVYQDSPRELNYSVETVNKYDGNKIASKTTTVKNSNGSVIASGTAKYNSDGVIYSGTAVSVMRRNRAGYLSELESITITEYNNWEQTKCTKKYYDCEQNVTCYLVNNNVLYDGNNSLVARAGAGETILLTIDDNGPNRGYRSKYSLIQDDGHGNKIRKEVSYNDVQITMLQRNGNSVTETIYNENNVMISKVTKQGNTTDYQYWNDDGSFKSHKTVTKDYPNNYDRTEIYYNEKGEKTGSSCKTTLPGGGFLYVNFTPSGRPDFSYITAGCNYNIKGYVVKVKFPDGTIYKSTFDVISSKRSYRPCDYIGYTGYSTGVGEYDAKGRYVEEYTDYNKDDTEIGKTKYVDGEEFVPFKERDSEYKVLRQKAVFALNNLANEMAVKYSSQVSSQGVILDTYDKLKNILESDKSSDNAKAEIERQKQLIKRLNNIVNGTSNEDFDETFEELMGVKFNEEKINDFIEKSYNAIEAEVFYLSALNFKNELKEASTMQDVYNVCIKYYGKENACYAMNSLFALNSNTRTSVFTNDGKIINENNEIISDLSSCNNPFNDICCEGIQDSAFQEYYNLLNEAFKDEHHGVDIETTIKEYNIAREIAFGSDFGPQNIINNYCKDNQEILEKISKRLQTTGTVITIIGHSITILSGGSLSGFGIPIAKIGKVIKIAGKFTDNVLEGVDLATSKDGSDFSMSNQDTIDLIKETIFEVTKLSLVDKVTGSFSSSSDVTEFLQTSGLSSKQATCVSWFVKLGTKQSADTLANLVKDGKIDLEPESISAFTNLISIINCDYT